MPARLPGPRGTLLLGSLSEFRRDMLGFMTRCAREYGDMSGFRLAHLRVCLVNDPKLIEQVLVQERDRVRKPWDLRELEFALGKGLLTSEGELWKRQRRLIQPAFTHERIRGYGEIMVRRAQAMVASWKDGEVRDLHADMARVTLEIVCEALFGFDISNQADQIGGALELVMRQFERMFTSTIPLPLWFPTPGNLGARRAIRRMDEVVFGIVARRRASGEQRDDLLGRLLAAQDADGKGMSDQQLRDELLTLIGAGHETTAIALAWTFFLLGRHPDVAARIASDLEALAGPPSVEDMGKLASTQEVVQESLRLYPPAWGIARENLEPIDLGGYHLERGTQIWLVNWVTQRDPRFFEEPEAFRPERFAPERASRIPKYAYFPFAGGPRSCVGMHFALLEATLVLACVLQKFRIELVPDHPVELQPSVTLRPRYGIRARVFQRAPVAAV
ncbi:MAG TPA: cytochrome P450 [Planctomycetota bacterium]|nr:cytochrome P450 [Planctomycetota bacterium]